MRWTERRRKLRALLEGDACHNPASVFDPMSARLAEAAGYDVAMLAGSVAAMSVLGAPDIILTTLSDFAEQCLRIDRATGLPLLVDADHGYGNAMNVMRTVEELEIAGVSALSIEDTVLPATFGKAAPSLISMEEGVGKMRAALEARRDPEMAIVGRTSAPAITDTDDAIRRLSAYQAAGVDALFVVGLKTPEDLQRLADAVDLPLIVSPPPKPWRDLAFLAQHKVRICLQPHVPIAAAINAAFETYKQLRAGTDPGDIAVAPKDIVAAATNRTMYDDWMRRFLDFE